MDVISGSSNTRIQNTAKQRQAYILAPWIARPPHWLTATRAALSLCLWRVEIMLDSLCGWATDWTAGVQFLTGARDFSLLHGFQTSYGAQSAYYTMGTGDFFPRDKATAS
jgi:hypothetical protein